MRLSEGDQDAYQQVFERYWGQIYAIGLKLFKSPELAKDLAQDTLMKLWHHRGQLPEITHFRAFLFTMARNLAINHLRKKVFTAGNEDFLVAHFCDDSITPHEQATYHELEIQLNNAINELPPQMQQVFRLSRFEGLSHAEIAVRMNISRVTSKSYIVRALTAIRQYMAQHYNEPISLAFLVFLLGK